MLGLSAPTVTTLGTIHKANCFQVSKPPPPTSKTTALSMF